MSRKLLEIVGDNGNLVVRPNAEHTNYDIIDDIVNPIYIFLKMNKLQNPTVTE